MEISKIVNFENILKQIVDFDIINFQISYLTEPGENYGSIMLKINVDGVKNSENKSMKMVAKLCPNNDIIKEAFLIDITFRKEVFAYERSIKAIQEFQSFHNCINDYFPICYGTKFETTNDNKIKNDCIIILENLKVIGYKTIDRMIGFDLNGATIILQNLAHLHATVIALKLINFDKFHKEIQPALKPVNVGSTMIDGFTDNALHFIKTIHELEPYVEKLEAIINRGKEIGGLKFPIETNIDFYSMIHTDFWTNNIMILEDEDKNIKVKFVDLQLLEHGSIARDVLFFLFTSVQTTILDKYFEYLLNSYYYNFHQYLCNYSVDFSYNMKYSRSEFYKEINNVAPCELFHIIFMLKPIFSEKGSIDNMDNISKDDFGRKDNIGQTYIERLRFVILMFVKNDWL